MENTKREIEIDCPNAFCKGHDHKRKACSYNPDKNLWHCFRCGSSGKATDLKKAGIHLPVNPYAPMTELQNLTAQHEVIDNMPAHTIGPADKEQWEYLKKRLGDQFEQCLQYFRVPEKVANAILILFPNSPYHQIRLLHHKKYINPNGIKKDVFCHIVPGRKYLFITEGIFDAICSGNGVATLGKIVPQGTLSRILHLLDAMPHTTPVVALDPDAQNDSFNLAYRMLKSGAIERVGVLKGIDRKDIGEYTNDAYMSLARKVSIFTNALSLKMSGEQNEARTKANSRGNRPSHQWRPAQYHL